MARFGKQNENSIARLEKLADEDKGPQGQVQIDPGVRPNEAALRDGLQG
jgi:hypothetical protein